MINTKRLRKAMEEIASKKGDFILFALLMRANAPGTWDLVVSAPWLEGGKLKSMNEFVRLLTPLIGKESLRQLARVEVLDRDAPPLKYILERFSNEDRELRVQSMDLLGLRIQEAIIFRAKKANQSTAGLLNRTRAVGER